MRYIQTYITPHLTEYAEALVEVFYDINTFIDQQLESDRVYQLIVAVIVTTPIVGTLLFVFLLSLSV